jgi:hypothetical protein
MSITRGAVLREAVVLRTGWLVRAAWGEVLRADVWRWRLFLMFFVVARGG